MLWFLIILCFLKGLNTMIFLHILSRRDLKTSRFPVHRGRWRSKRRLRRRALGSWNWWDLDMISFLIHSAEWRWTMTLSVILLKEGRRLSRLNLGMPDGDEGEFMYKKKNALMIDLIYPVREWCFDFSSFYVTSRDDILDILPHPQSYWFRIITLKWSLCPIGRSHPWCVQACFMLDFSYSAR